MQEVRNVVGIIDGYEVIYIQDKNIIFCKNTTLPFKLICNIITGNIDRTEIEEKKLTITKDDYIITMGCLTTTKDNCIQIIKEVNRLNNKK